MKIVLYLLCFANLILFGWLYTNPERFAPQTETAVAPLPLGVEPLRLLSERERMDSSGAAESALTVNQRPEAVAADAQHESSSTTVVEMPATKTEPGPDAAITAEATPEAETAAPLSPPVPICQAIGPFQSRADVDRFKATLNTTQIKLNVRSAQMEYPADYWVYLSEMPAAEARAIMKDLAAKGVKDTFLGRQNFISLGVFSDKRTAEVRARDIRQHGYEPKVEPRFRSRDVFWVDIEETPASSRLTDADWSARLSAWPDVRRQSVSCE